MLKQSVGLGMLTLALIGCGPADRQPQGELSADIQTQEEQQSMTVEQVIADLKEGNERFVRGQMIARDYQAQVKATAAGQYPKAAVLSCLDSRVPVEIILDQGIGDLFVGRVAGNIEDQTMIGSFEFATSVAGAKLILVLGHSECGAVKGAVDRDLVRELGHENLDALLDHINPAVEAALQPGEERTSNDKDLVDRAIRENVLLTMDRIRQASPDLNEMEANGTVRIVGGVYDLTTGRISWF